MLSPWCNLYCQDDQCNNYNIGRWQAAGGRLPTLWGSRPFTLLFVPRPFATSWIRLLQQWCFFKCASLRFFISKSTKNKRGLNIIYNANPWVTLGGKNQEPRVVMVVKGSACSPSIFLLVKSFLGNFYQHLAIYSGRTAEITISMTGADWWIKLKSIWQGPSMTSNWLTD